MRLDKEFVRAAAWLHDHGRGTPNCGWGLTPKQNSSLLNTAEAAFVFSRAPGFEAQHSEALAYIQDNLEPHLRERGARTRYVAYACVALADTPWANQDCIDFCQKWLLSSRNADGAWGDEAADQASSLFSTYLAVWALRSLRSPEPQFVEALRWLLAHAREDGWAFQPGAAVNVVATAYACYCLAPDFEDHPTVRAGARLLLQNRHWGHQETTISGTIWRHSVQAAVIPALLEMGTPPYLPVIAEGVRHLNSLETPDGWRESKSVGVTIRSQFWAVRTLSCLRDHFNPVHDIPAMDATRAETELTDPEWTKIWVQTPWAAILPTRLYRSVTYTLILAALALLLGLHKSVTLDARADALLATVSLVLAFALVRKRPLHFERLTAVALYSAAALALLNLVGGVTLLQILEGFSTFFR